MGRSGVDCQYRSTHSCNGWWIPGNDTPIKKPLRYIPQLHRQSCVYHISPLKDVHRPFHHMESPPIAIPSPNKVHQHRNTCFVLFLSFLVDFFVSLRRKKEGSYTRVFCFERIDNDNDDDGNDDEGVKAHLGELETPSLYERSQKESAPPTPKKKHTPCARVL